MSVLILDGGGSTVGPASVAPREYRGNMCGVRVLGAPEVPGGSRNSNLILSWFYMRYSSEWRAEIRREWKAQGYLDVLCSWQDDAAVGFDPDEIIAGRQELVADGFRPCEWLSSKYYSPQDDATGTWKLIQPMLTAFLNADCISRYCVGAELNLWNTNASLQELIDRCAWIITPKLRPLSLHFSPGYSDWRPDHPGSTFAEFWNAQIGKVESLWFQSNPYPEQTPFGEQAYQLEVEPILYRFGGGANCSPDSGFGHPFDLISLEVTAINQFNEGMSEEEGDRRGQLVLDTPPINGIRVMGSGNGSMEKGA